MNAPRELSDAAIETMLLRRARRADPADLAEVALDAVRRAPAPPSRPWDGLVASLHLVSGSTRVLRLAIAALLALALVAGMLGVGARLLRHPFPVLTGNPAIGLGTVAVSGDELWTTDNGLWHYVDGAWQGPLSPPPLNGGIASFVALGPDRALWVSSGTAIAVLRDGAWSLAWKAPPDTWLSGLVVGSDGTVWVGDGHDLVGLRRDGAGYTARSVECPTQAMRIAAATDGAVYVGGFLYGGGRGLARSDGTTCAFVDPLGDGQVHEVSDLSAGPGGSLLATVFDETAMWYGNSCGCTVWLAMLRDGHWSTISGPTLETGIGPGPAIDRDGHPWRIESNLGLQRYGGGVWRVVAPSAQSLVMAPDGVLWYTTDRGIERLWTDDVGD